MVLIYYCKKLKSSKMAGEIRVKSFDIINNRSSLTQGTAGTSCMNVTQVQNLDSWTKDEKYYLLQALKEFGSQNIQAIAENVQTKSPEDVFLAINYYKSKSLRHPVNRIKKRKLTSNIHAMPRLPLVKWAKKLTESLDFNELQTEIPTALRLIAEFEDIPLPVCTSNFDFRKLYLMMANAMEGKALVEDKQLMTILRKCIVETALTSKAFIKQSTLNKIVNALDINEKQAFVLQKPTDNPELSNFRYLTSQKRYNPLNIPENFLKPSIYAQEF